MTWEVICHDKCFIAFFLWNDIKIKVIRGPSVVVNYYKTHHKIVISKILQNYFLHVVVDISNIHIWFISLISMRYHNHACLFIHPSKTIEMELTTAHLTLLFISIYMLMLLDNSLLHIFSSLLLVLLICDQNT